MYDPSFTIYTADLPRKLSLRTYYQSKYKILNDFTDYSYMPVSVTRHM